MPVKQVPRQCRHLRDTPSGKTRLQEVERAATLRHVAIVKPKKETRR